MSRFSFRGDKPSGPGYEIPKNKEMSEDPEKRAEQLATRLVDVFKFGKATKDWFSASTEKRQPLSELGDNLSSRDESKDAIIPASIAVEVEDFIIGRTKAEERNARWDHTRVDKKLNDAELEDPTFNIIGFKNFLNQSLQEKGSRLSSSRTDASAILAFVTFIENAKTLKLFVTSESAHDGAWGVVSEEEYKKVKEKIPNNESLGLLGDSLLEKAGPILAEILDHESFINAKYFSSGFVYLVMEGGLSRDLVRRFFATPERQSASLDILKSVDTKSISLEYLVEQYEFVFGEFTLEQINEHWPEWQNKFDYFLKLKLYKRFNIEEEPKEPLPEPKEPLPEPKEPLPEPKEPLPEPKEYLPKSSHVYLVERELLSQRKKDKKLDKPPRSILGYTKREPSVFRDNTVTDRSEILYIDELRGEQRKTVFIPLEKTKADFLETTLSSLEKFEREEDDQKKWEIFFAEVWPAFLIARAHKAIDTETEDIFRDTLRRTGGRIAGIVSELVVSSANIDSNKDKIRQLAKELRSNEELHKMGLYSHVEIISRLQADRRSGSYINVNLLSGLTHEIDAISTYQVDGHEDKILELGNRTDKLDEDLSGLGFNFIGDRFGVIIKPSIVRYSNNFVIPELNDSTRYQTQGMELHHLNYSVRDAVRRDHAANPKKDTYKDIYDKQFRSTSIHELEHIRQDRFRFALNRVEQETAAYLSSIADLNDEGRPNQPFTDLAHVVDFFVHSTEHSYSDAGPDLNNYRLAMMNIILLLDQKMKLGLEPVEPGGDYKDVLDKFLMAVLQTCKTPEDLQQVASSILQELRSGDRKKVDLAILSQREVEVKDVRDYFRPPTRDTKEPKNRKSIAAKLGMMILLLGLKADSRLDRSPEEMMSPPSQPGVSHFEPDGQTEHVNFVNPLDQGVTEHEAVSLQTLEQKEASLKYGIWGYAELRLKEVQNMMKKDLLDKKSFNSINYLLMQRFLDHLKDCGLISEDSDLIIAGPHAHRVVVELDKQFPPGELLEWLGQK